MTSQKGLTIVAAILAGGTSFAKAQSILPWEYVVAPGVFITRPGYGVPPGYVVVPPGYAVRFGILHRPDAFHGTWGAITAPQNLARTKQLTPRTAATNTARSSSEARVRPYGTGAATS
jgi:hypothetical protein